MKKNLFLLGAATSCLLFVSLASSSQGKVAREISAADKAVILDMFKKSLKTNQYYLEFNYGKPSFEKYGSLDVTPAGLSQMRQNITPLVDYDNLDAMTFFKSYPEMSFLYAMRGTTYNGAETYTLEKFLGKANAARVEAIINKYTGGH